MTLGFLAAVPGLALMALAGRLPVVVGLAIVSLGIQVVLALTYDVVVSSAPPERAGVASGMGETGSELGIALGIAIAGSLVTAVYRVRSGRSALWRSRRCEGHAGRRGRGC